MELEGRGAVVTGGGTGLGRAISLALAREGCNIAIVYPGADEQGAGETAREAVSLGVKAIPVRADVSVAAEVAAMAETANAALGRIDILVNNAGTTVFVPMPDLDAVLEADWDRIMAVNVKGAFLCARAVAPMMRAQQGGRILNTASVAGLRASGSSMPYSVSKHALIGLTRCLALALAPDILVNAIAPGLMPTRWGLHFGEPGMAEIVQRNLTKRVTPVGDVAAAALALVKNDSITGQTLVVDGGGLMH